MTLNTLKVVERPDLDVEKIPFGSEGTLYIVTKYETNKLGSAYPARDKPIAISCCFQPK